MNYLEKAKQHLNEACLNGCDHLYWRPQDVIECFADALQEAHELGRSERDTPSEYVRGYEQGLKVGRAESAELEECLRFYANELSYSTDDYRGVSGEMIHRCVLYGDSEERNDVYSFAGRRARAALAKRRKEY